MILTANNLKKKYGDRYVVNDVSIHLKRGEIVGLLGPNGAGKTTTFYMLVGLIRSFEGSVLIDKMDISSDPMYIRARKGVGYLPQQPSVFTKMSVEDNILTVLETLYVDNIKRCEELENILEDFGLLKIRKTRADLLSGGERRRVEIARSISMKPSFILLDEPFAGVDPIAIQDIQSMVKKLKSRNIGVLITDHNVRETLSITDRSYLLYDGSVLKYGKTSELINDSEVRKLYLGDNFKF
ncbi:MAG: LPS export ABC transporter ATP-binding protein [Flavobacteriales bacterium]|jgi:lipopolysaccharide export system ATP-binding protein|nr:LPS export ABC transporter ATP-binding protein [Flavobacteriales bacterium]|tara:strand:- start:14112 stop:14831 length:720 start_codon:yes stop_codon:yes gene_type:complete